MKLGEYVDNYCSAHGISRRQFALNSGLSHGYISILISGINPNTGKPFTPTLQSLKKVADGMGISLDVLLANVDDMPIDLSEAAESYEKIAPPISGKAMNIAIRYDKLGKRDKLIIDTLVDVMTTSRGAGHLHIVQQAAKSGDRMDELLTDEELAERSKYLGESPRPDDTEE